MTLPTAAERIHFPPPAQHFSTALDTAGVLAFHRRLPGYAPTPLVQAGHVAAALGVHAVWVKDESQRLGLPAFKILGASWASYRALKKRFGLSGTWTTLDELAESLRPHLPLTLVAATDGNHGRAVARMARWLGLQAHILVPEEMVPARRDAIAAEGAQVTVIDGSYDDAVDASARLADDRHLVISDTAWEGYEDVPGWVIEGYATIYAEADEQLRALGAPAPEVVAVQMGVGALAASVVKHYRAAGSRTQVVGAEPLAADCVLRSAVAGQPVDVPGPHGSSMAGLNCGRPSPLAWPFVSAGLSAYVAVPDSRAEEAMRLLAQDGVESGESGAAGLAGLLALCSGPRASEHRAALGINGNSSVLILSTEGATDPQNYARIVGTRARP